MSKKGFFFLIAVYKDTGNHVERQRQQKKRDEKCTETGSDPFIFAPIRSVSMKIHQKRRIPSFFLRKWIDIIGVHGIWSDQGGPTGSQPGVYVLGSNQAGTASNGPYGVKTSL